MLQSERDAVKGDVSRAIQRTWMRVRARFIVRGKMVLLSLFGYPQNGFVIPSFVVVSNRRRVLGMEWLVVRAEIDRFFPPLLSFFFFFWKWNLKFLRLIKTFHQIFQISQSKGYFSHYELVSRSRDELLPHWIPMNANDFARANRNNWHDEDRIWSISLLLVASSVYCNQPFTTYYIYIYIYVTHVWVYVFRNINCLPHRCARKYRRSCKSDCSSLLSWKENIEETNCFFIRSNILIDSIRFWMNYSFREEWRNPLSIYIYIYFIRRYIVF